MGRLKLQMQISVDGRDASGPDDDMSWDEIKDYSRDLLDSADTIVIGRKTAVDFIPYWDKAAADAAGSWHEVAQRIANAKKVVFSRTLDGSDWNNTRIEKGDLVERIERLKKSNEKDILVYGGVSFVASLIKNKLIDELHLFVNPIAIGTGVSIFGGLSAPQRLKLVKAIGYDSGLVLQHYELK